MRTVARRGRRLATSLWILAAILGGCGSVASDMREEIRHGEYRQALALGDAYIAEEPDGDERGPVLDQIVEARFQLACIGGARDLRHFIQAYGDTPRAAAARALLSRIDYEQRVRGSGDPEVYERYLKESPDGHYTREAAVELHELAWRLARDEDSIAAYRVFRERFPDSNYRSAAKEGEYRLVWAESERVGSPQTFLDLAARYAAPEDTEFASRAKAEATARAERERARSEAESVSEAEREGTVSAWLRHAIRFPLTETGRAALERAAAIVDGGGDVAIDPVVWHEARAVFPNSAITERLDAMALAFAWERTERDDTLEAYRNFRAAFAASDFAAVADKRAATLAWFASTERPENDDELIATVNLTYAPDGEDVELLVQVKEQGGRLVGGLLAPDFHVVENGRDATITSFAGMESNRPVDIVFVVDTSGGMSSKLAALRESMAQFAEVLAFRQRDARFALVTFVEEVAAKSAFTASATVFKEWAAKVPVGQGSAENPMRGLAAALRYPFRSAAQKVVVLVTDEPPGIAFDPVSQMTLPAAADALFDRRVTTFVMAPEHPIYRDFLRRTKGVFFDIAPAVQPGVFAGQVMAIADLLSRQYMIKYASPRPLRPGQERVTRVRVERPGVWAGAGKLDATEIVDVLHGFGTDCELLAVATDGSLRYSADCGASWDPLDAGHGKRVVSAVSGAGGWVFLRTESGDVIRLKLGNAGGVTMVQAAGLSNVTATAPGAATGQVFWVAAGKLFRSGDSGHVASVSLPIAGQAVVDVASDLEHGRTCILLDDGSLLCLEAGGEWKRTGRVAGVTAIPAGAKLALDPWHDGVMYLSLPGEPVLQSLSGGRHWRPLSAAPALPSAGGRTLFFGHEEGSNRVCIATTDGLVCSADGGLSWAAPGVGLDTPDGGPPIVVDSDEGTLLVSRKGGEVFRLRSIEDREFVSAQVYFASGVAAPKARLLPLLEQIGARLAKDGGLRLRVDGHTDSDGDDASNLELSKRRAASVRQILLSNGGRPEQVITFGYGESRPLRPNTTGANKQANRRVELISYH